jgi:hypothetical protein
MNAQRIFQSLILCALLALTISPALAQDPSNAQDQQAQASQGGLHDVLERLKKALVGTWATKITPPAASGVPAFPGFFTFTSDGNLIATQAGGEFPALGNPQLGLWTHNGGRQFTITYFLQDFDEKFQQTGSEEEHATITLNDAGDQFTGIVDINVFDLDGKLLFSACCAAFEGKRLSVKPPRPNSNNLESEAQLASPTQNEAAALGNPEWGWGRKRARTQP